MAGSLLKRVADGDKSAMKEVMDQFGGLVWSLARKSCYNPADAEDATREIFLDIWKSAARFDASKGSETLFVAMLARRRLIDRIRGQGREPRMEDIDAPGFELASSTAAEGETSSEAMPGALRARIEGDAEAWFSNRDEARPTASVTSWRSRRRGVTTWGGWLAAAAALVLALLGWIEVERMETELATVRDPPPDELLAAVEARPGTQVLPWSATADPAASGAEGAVVWNRAEQVGLMRFRGLAANDPAVSQYQLWIFDAERDERFPVDGGVFDVPAGTDEVLVPIRPRVPVMGEVALFAITVEPPGGVVVSSRERIALVAQPEA